MIGSGGLGNNVEMAAGLLLGNVGLVPHAAESVEARARTLVQAHFDFVWRLLRRLGVPESDVDDAAQHVFIVAAQRLSDIVARSERTFLYGTALRVAATLRRDQKRRRRWVEPGPADSASSDPTPHEELERRQALAFLDEVLHELDAELREVFVLSEIEELSAPEVAEIVGAKVGTVASRLRRARRKFDEQARRLQAQRARGR